MSWFQFVRSAFQTVIQVGSAVTNATQVVTSNFIKGAKWVADRTFEMVQAGLAEPPKTVREYQERELQEINRKISHLRERCLNNQGLTETEDAEWQYLRQRRKEIIDQLRDTDQAVTSEEVVKKESDFQDVSISHDNVHILQFFTGHSTYNKVCLCGRSMTLQWKSNVQNLSIRDFFWSCSGWYQHKPDGSRLCDNCVNLSADDLRLFAYTKRPEFQVTSQELNQEVLLNSHRAQRIRDALDSIRSDHRARGIGIATYRCPIHGESLVMRRKRAARNNILDEYFLGCPRWLPNNVGCNFIMKLKSAAQISSVVDTEYGQDIFKVMQ